MTLVKGSVWQKFFMSMKKRKKTIILLILIIIVIALVVFFFPKPSYEWGSGTGTTLDCNCLGFEKVNADYVGRGSQTCYGWTYNCTITNR